MAEHDNEGTEGGKGSGGFHQTEPNKDDICRQNSSVQLRRRRTTVGYFDDMRNHGDGDHEVSQPIEVVPAVVEVGDILGMQCGYFLIDVLLFFGPARMTIVQIANQLFLAPMVTLLVFLFRLAELFEFNVNFDESHQYGNSFEANSPPVLGDGEIMRLGVAR